MSGANLDRANNRSDGTVGTDGTESRVVGDRYQLNVLIGTGASAEVFQATDLRLGRQVAVKQLRSNLTDDLRFAKLFRSEAYLAAQLSHPNILTVFDWSADADGEDGGAYIVTELLGGGTLRSVLDAETTLSLAQTGYIGLQAARGLAVAHQAGLVHRDIKPANLLFGGDGRVHIGDFGIARAVAQAAWTEPEGVLIGTARYAAPEQAKTGSIDGLVDVYSLAVCMVEALTGEVPLVQETAIGTMVIRQSEDLPIDESFGVLAEPLAWAGLADPAYRATAVEFADALAAVCRTLPDPDPLILLDLTEHTGGPLAVHSLADQAAAQDQDGPPPNVHIGADGELIIEGDDSDLALPAGEGGPAQPAQRVGEAADTDHLLDDGPYDEQRSDRQESGDDAAGVYYAGAFADDDGGSRRWRWVLGLAVFAALLAGAGFAGRSLAQAQRVETETIALGLPSYPVPGFADLSAEEIEAVLAENGWTMTVTEEFADDTRPGELLFQNPEPGTAMGPGGAVQLVRSLGPVPRQVPEMIGRRVDTVTTLIERASLRVGSVVERADESVEAGLILEATIDGVPAQPGTEFLTGTTIDLVVSSGPAPREVPSLVGLSVADARALVEAENLTLTTAESYSESVTEGLIIGMDPAPGAAVARGSAVTVTVSLGRPFVTVPDVIGQPVLEAIESLKAAGFAVEINGNVGSDVIATRPTGGESVRSGTSIEIISDN